MHILLYYLFGVLEKKKNMYSLSSTSTLILLKLRAELEHVLYYCLNPFQLSLNPNTHTHISTVNEILILDFFCKLINRVSI